MTVRKNFNFRDEVAKHLEEIARYEGKTMTQVVEEAVEERYRRFDQQKRKQAFNEFIGVLNGQIGDIDLKEIRMERALKRAK
jgi:hypothetical protein